MNDLNLQNLKVNEVIKFDDYHHIIYNYDIDLNGMLGVVKSIHEDKKYKGFKVINGDETDLRFLDPKNCIVGLIAKGKAKKDYSGFVLDN